MRVVWTSPARDDLVRQRRYIAERNPIAANRIGAVIVTAAARLGETPALGWPGRIAGTRELVVAGTPFIIAYRLPETSIEILRVLHGAQLWPDSF